MKMSVLMMGLCRWNRGGDVMAIKTMTVILDLLDLRARLFLRLKILRVTIELFEQLENERR
jgi:hypothetical protein